jgi:glycosyltransferase involved in cell wall biosynthesis
VIHPVCHLIDSNVETPFFRSIARNQDRERFPVHIGSIAPPGALQEAMAREGTPTFSLGVSRRWQYGRAIARLVRVIRREKIALLHAHCFDPTAVGLIAARLAGIRFVFTRHHSDHHIRLGKRWHTRIDAWCARRADHVIAVSEATRRIMMDIERVPGERITVVHNGMEPLREPEPEGVARVRRELGLTGAAICLTPARLHEEKGHRFLFDAVPGIVSRVGPVTFLLAGEGAHRADLEAQVRARGLQDRVRFLGWRKDVPELIGLSSLVVLPSLAESFGFSLLEAMSLGKPVVATTVGGIPEVVAAGETGLLVPPADAGGLGEAVGRVLGDPSLAAALGNAGRRRAASFSFGRMIQGYEAVYGRLLSRRAAPDGGLVPGPSCAGGTS